MDDTSLDEFLDSGSAAEAETAASESEEPMDEDADTDGSDRDGAAETESTETVEPATPTAMWTESGEHCDRCGAETQRLWIDDEAAVCRDCKEW